MSIPTDPSPAQDRTLLLLGHSGASPMAVHMDPALGTTTTSMLKPYIPQYPVSIGHGSAAVYKDKDKGIMMMCGSSKDVNPTFCYNLRIGRDDRARMTMTSYGNL